VVAVGKSCELSDFDEEESSVIANFDDAAYTENINIWVEISFTSGRFGCTSCFICTHVIRILPHYYY
jgi:hypothetical protein